MARHRVAVLLLDGALPLDFAIPIHVLSREAGSHYDVRTASPDGGPIGLAGGSRVLPDGDLAELAAADTVLVPGFDGAASAVLDPAVLDAIREAAARGARMASICSGAFALAQAGVLDGLTVTTHWSMGDELARGFPQVTVDAAALVVDQGSVLTSGGVLAGVDLALHLIRADVGDSLANHIARRVVLAPRPEGSQGQFAEAPPLAPGDGAIARAQRWMSEQLDRPLTVADVADHVHLSPRQLHRRFVDELGVAPLGWLQAQRIARAKELLESTDRSVDDVARASGLGTAANLRDRFRRATGVSPSAYRQAFWSSTSLGVG